MYIHNIGNTSYLKSMLIFGETKTQMRRRERERESFSFASLFLVSSLS